METVIAIGVIAVLLTGFVAVFAPAAQGIRRALNIEEINRLASTLERELVTLRDGQSPAAATSGFDKAYDWILNSHNANDALMVYQYRGTLGALRTDGTATPYTQLNGIPGSDYIVQAMLRRKSDPLFLEDVKAAEGGVYVVKCTQLIEGTGSLGLGSPGSIVAPPNSGSGASGVTYPGASIAFAAQFFALPTRDIGFLTGGGFTSRFSDLGSPVFTRNLAVRR